MVKKTDMTRRFGFAPLFGCVASCGPALTDPSPESITGHWTAAESVGPIQNLVMDLTQAGDGSVSGTWSGKVTAKNVICPPELGTAPSGPVSGNHTVIGITLSVLG